ncbi:MAG: hypothetical protein KBT21_07975 [Treponema sp.]|nr:hypothetical protein [Candidatus Treponema merdequi]
MTKLEGFIRIIFAGISFLYFIIQIAVIKIWRNKISRKTGDLVYKTQTPKISKTITVLVICPVLIILSLLTRATTFICCLMCVVSCLACYINVREIVYSKLNGIYTNGLVGSAKFIPFDKIETYPDTSFKEPEKQNTVSLAIQLKAESNAQKPAVFFMDFASISEYSKVVAAIKGLKQNR